MSLKQEYYVQAETAIKNRKAANALKLDNRRREIAERIPDMAAIYRVLDNTSARLVQIVVGGNNGNAKVSKTRTAADVTATAIAAVREENRSALLRKRTLLKQNGYPENYLDIIYSCKKCLDTGVYENTPCECFKTELKRISAEQINKTSRIRLKTFAEFKVDYQDGDERRWITTIRDFCKDYAENFHKNSRSILMYGGPGLGKTHLSLAIADVVIGKGFSVIHRTAPNLFREIERQHFGKDYTDDFINTLIDTDLLIIDDLGAEFSNSFTISALYNILTSRANAGLPIIVSTNLTMDELENIYSKRIISRVSMMEIQEFRGRDVRPQLSHT